MSDRSAELLRLVEVANLEEITFREISAVERDPEESEVPDFSPSFALGIRPAGAHEDRLLFGIHLRFEAEAPGGTMTVEPYALYSVPQGDDAILERHVLTEYANEVAVMTLLPYLREAIADVSRKVLGSEILMPIMPRGAIHFD